MKLTILDNKGKEQVFDNITDYCITIRQMIPVQFKDKSKGFLPEVKSFSCEGNNLRELVKEVNQSAFELQRILGERNGGSK